MMLWPLRRKPPCRILLCFRETEICEINSKCHPNFVELFCKNMDRFTFICIYRVEPPIGM